MNQDTTNFKAKALEFEELKEFAPSIFASGPMLGVSKRYTFVSTAEIVSGLRELNWVPVHVTEYRYDYRNRMAAVIDRTASGTITQTVEFTYDALNRRIAKSVNGAVMRFLLNQENVWADADGHGAIRARYLLSNRIDEMLARYRPGEALVWYLTDNLSTVRDLVDSIGAVVNHVSYDSFGRILAQTTPPAGDRFVFTGREWDSESQLVFLRSRYYSPSLGRFFTMDPMGLTPGDPNFYRYVFNHPTIATDPTGEAEFAEGSTLLIVYSTTVGAASALICVPKSAPLADKLKAAAAGGLVGAIGGILTALGGPISLWDYAGVWVPGVVGPFVFCPRVAVTR